MKGALARKLLGVTVLVLAGWLMVTVFVTPEAVAEIRPFDSSRQCQECHADVYAEWEQSWHAQAWTDEEWLQHVGERFEGQQRERLEQLFADCAEVKYGGETPTHWAARERAEAARRLALELGAKGTALQVEPAQGANPPEEVAR